MDSIYSLTIKIIERIFSNSEKDGILKEIARSFENGDFAKTSALAGSALYEAAVESPGRIESGGVFHELSFVKGIAEYTAGNYESAAGHFSACQKHPGFAAYSNLFLALICEKREAPGEAFGYISAAVKNFPQYYYFKMICLKFKLGREMYHETADEAGALIEELGRKNNEIKLLPSISMRIIDAGIVSKYFKKLFASDEFLPELLFIAAEANFNLENYDVAFEYYKETSFSRRDDERIIMECFYKMASCKIRIGDFVTARELLENLIKNVRGRKEFSKYYANAMLDLAGLYEFYFNAPAECIRTLIEYTETAGDDSDALYRLGKLLYDSGRPNEALIYFNRADGKIPAYKKECSYLIGKCYFIIGMHLRSLEVLEKLISESAQEPAGEGAAFDDGRIDFDIRLMIVKNYMLLKKNDIAEKAVNELKRYADDSRKYLECTRLSSFLRMHGRSATVVLVENCESPSKTAPEPYFKISIFKGFIKEGEYERSTLAEFTAVRPESKAGAIIIAAPGISAGSEKLIFREFAGCIILNEREVPHFKAVEYCVSIVENPPGVKEINPALRFFTVLIWLFGSLDLSCMPELFEPPGTGESSEARDAEYIYKSGLLNLYHSYRKDRAPFEFIDSYCKISVIESAELTGQAGDISLWPFMVNFKNIDIPGTSGAGRGKYLVNGCDDIFLYNFFRSVTKNGITGSAHIFVENGKKKHYEQMLDFIFKKLEITDVSIETTRSVSEIICMRKVNLLLSQDMDDMNGSFDTLLLILAIRAGVKNSREIIEAAGRNVFEKIKFRQRDCDYESCPDKKECKILEIIEKYQAPEKKATISSYDNFLYFYNSKNELKAFNNVSDFIFCNLADFYNSADAFFEFRFSLERLKKEISGLITSGAAPESADKLTILFDNLESLMPFGFDHYENENAIKRTIKPLGGLLDELDAGGLMELEKLKSVCSLYSAPKYAGFIKSRLVSENGDIFYIITSDRWTQEIFFSRNIGRVYFINPEDQNCYYEKKSGELLKFFNRINLAEIYRDAAGRNAGILVAPENSSDISDITAKFINSGKNAGNFFINFAENRSLLEKHKTAGRILNCQAASPSGIEPYLPGMDCVIVNFLFRDVETAYSTVSILKNLIIKYNNDIFWVIVSTGLYDACFSKKSNVFQDMYGVRFFSNIIEYSQGFIGHSENAKFLRSVHESNFYPENGVGQRLDKDALLFGAPALAQFRKAWKTIGHEMMHGRVNNIISEKFKVLEYSIFMICYMAHFEKLKKTVYVYFPYSFLANGFKKLCAECGLVYNRPDDEKCPITIISGENQASMTREIKKSNAADSVLMTFDPAPYDFSSRALDAPGYAAWNEISSKFNNRINYIFFRPSRDFKASERDFDCSFFEKSQVKSSPDAKAKRSAVEFNEYSRVITVITDDFKENPEAVFIICVSDEDEKYLASALAGAESATPMPPIYRVHFENGHRALDAALSFTAASCLPRYIYMVEGPGSGRDAATFDGYLDRDSNGRNFKVTRLKYVPDNPIESAMPPLRFHDVRYLDFFLMENAGKNMVISRNDFTSMMPVSSFSRQSLFRALVLILKTGKIRIEKPEQDETNHQRIIDYKTFAELEKQKIIRFDVPMTEEFYSEFNFTGLLKYGFIKIINEDEFIDKIILEMKAPVRLKIDVTSKFDEGLQLLKKTHGIRKTILKCFYDIPGYAEGKWVSLPFLEYNDIPRNDYYYIRELCPLSWHSICELTKMPEGNPGIKRTFKQGNADSKLEKLYDYIVELYASLYAMKQSQKLKEPAGPVDIINQILNSRQTSDRLVKSEYKPSYLNKMLKQLMLYGLINYEVDSPLAAPGESMKIIIPANYKNLDYKEFLDIYEKLVKGNA